MFFPSLKLYFDNTNNFWQRSFCSVFVLFSLLSLIYLGQQGSSQEIDTSNTTIINPPPQQNPAPAFNPPPQQNPAPAFNPPPQQNPPPPSGHQTSAGEADADYPILQVSSPLVLALVVAAYRGNWRSAVCVIETICNGRIDFLDRQSILFCIHSFLIVSSLYLAIRKNIDNYYVYTLYQ